MKNYNILHLKIFAPTLEKIRNQHDQEKKRQHFATKYFALKK